MGALSGTSWGTYIRSEKPKFKLQFNAQLHLENCFPGNEIGPWQASAELGGHSSDPTMVTEGSPIQVAVQGLTASWKPNESKQVTEGFAGAKWDVLGNHERSPDLKIECKSRSFFQGIRYGLARLLGS